MENHKALLVLEDGTVFHGRAVGAIGTTQGEIAFNTGMYGYQEIFTDPSYFGQILIMATAHIGNYGVHADEAESEGVKISGLVTKKFSELHSRVGAVGDLQGYLLKNRIVGISDIDTRALVRHIREKGAMNAVISSDILDESVLRQKVLEVPSMAGLELASKVSTDKYYTVTPSRVDYEVALIDYGVKTNIIRCLTERGCRVHVFPYNTGASEVLGVNPDGIMLSNGPGDPAAMTEAIKVVAELVKSEKPCFGICLGHQLLALSQGLKTEKMFNGHRGVNHPVKNLITGKSEITSQNHGFVIADSSVSDQKNVRVTHRHLNDNSIAGIALEGLPVYSVQYHPEASAGPHDGRYLFDDFIKIMATGVAQTA